MKLLQAAVVLGLLALSQPVPAAKENSMKWAHVALNCVNVQQTIDFYSQHFGFQVTRRLPIGEGKEIVFMKLGEAYLELFPGEGQAVATPNDGPNQVGSLRHFALQVDSVDAVLSKMGPAADIAQGPMDFDAFIPGWRTVWLRDPNGHIVEITQGYRD